MRGIQRTFGVSGPTLASWLKKDEANPKLEETLLPCRARRCPGSRRNVVLCPEKLEQTLAVDNHVSPNAPNRGFCNRRSERSNLSQTVGSNPTSLQRLPKLQRFPGSLPTFFPEETHTCVGKGSGQTNHMERWYCTLMQSCARFVRKTLSFSKSDAMHEIATRLFIIRHNLSLVT